MTSAARNSPTRTLRRGRNRPSFSRIRSLMAPPRLWVPKPPPCPLLRKEGEPVVGSLLRKEGESQTELPPLAKRKRGALRLPPLAKGRTNALLLPPLAKGRTNALLLPPLAKGRVGVGSVPSPCSWGEGQGGGLAFPLRSSARRCVRGWPGRAAGCRRSAR